MAGSVRAGESGQRSPFQPRAARYSLRGRPLCHQDAGNNSIFRTRIVLLFRSKRRVHLHALAAVWLGVILISELVFQISGSQDLAACTTHDLADEGAEFFLRSAGSAGGGRRCGIALRFRRGKCPRGRRIRSSRSCTAGSTGRRGWVVP